jgi:hypothetical protein
MVPALEKSVIVAEHSGEILAYPSYISQKSEIVFRKNTIGSVRPR